MPQYRNTSTDVITVGSVRFEPNVPVTTKMILRTLPSGLTLISASPQQGFNVSSSALYSGNAAATQEIAIPAEKRYQVSIVCITGALTVHLNNDTTNKVYMGIGKVIKFFVDGEVTEKVMLTYTVSPSSAQVDVLQDSGVSSDWCVVS